MMKEMLLGAGLTALFAGCCCTGTADNGETLIGRAAAMIGAGEAECVLIRHGEIVPQKRGHGVSPLLDLYDHDPAGMNGGIIVDKVIGRAAASIVVCGKAARVHGVIMSEDAAEYLKSRGIRCSWGTLVPRILNRDRSGLCPLEKSVEGIDDPELALAALRAKIAELQQRR